MSPGRKGTFNRLERRQQNFRYARSQSICLSRTQSFQWATDHLFALPGLYTYLEQSTLPRKCRKPGLAANLMQMAKSEATSTAVDVAKLRATGR